MTTATSAVSALDLRCPIGAQKLLGRIRQEGGWTPVVEGNLLELACRDCRASVAAKEGRKPSLVVHRYDILGELVESEVYWT